MASLDLEEAPSSMEVELPAGSGTLLQGSAIPNSLRNSAKMVGMTKNGVDFWRKFGETVGISTWILGCSTNKRNFEVCENGVYPPVACGEEK